MAERAEIVITGRDQTAAAFATAQRNLMAMRTSAVSLAASLGPVTAGIGALTAGLSVVNFSSLVKGLDALNDVKDATGASIENISALEDIGARTGTTFDTVGSSLIKFNQALQNTKPGSETAAILKSIGLNAEELKRIDPAEALRQTAVALAGFADDGEKARRVQALFGKSTREIAPFLKDLAEAGKLNATVTTAQAKAAEDFNKQIAALEKNVKDVARNIASDLVPTVSELLTQLTDGRKVFGNFTDALINLGTLNPANSLAENIANTRGEMEKLNGQLADLQRREEEYVKAGARSGQFQPQIEQLQRRLDLLTKTDTFLKAQQARGALRLGEGVADDPRIASRARLPSLTPLRETTKETVTAAEQYIKKLQDAHFASLDLNEVEKAREAILRGELDTVDKLTGKVRKLTEAEKGQIQVLAESLDQLRRTTQLDSPQAAFRKLEIVDMDKVNAELRKGLDDLDAQLRDFSGEAANDRKRALVARLEQRLAAGEQIAAADLERMVKGIAGLKEAAEETKGVADELGFTFASAFEDAIVEGEKFSDILKALDRDLLRITTRKLVTEPFAESITNLIKGVQTDGLGDLTKRLGFGGGADTAAQTATATAATTAISTASAAASAAIASADAAALASITSATSAALSSIAVASGSKVGGDVFSGIGGEVLASIFHTGGVVGGAGGTLRAVDPVVWAGATRYHGGGIAGLAADEVPAILQRGEEVLTAADPRHRANGSASSAPARTLVINVAPPPNMSKQTATQFAAEVARQAAIASSRNG
jgi:hypothetical protein